MFSTLIFIIVLALGFILGYKLGQHFESEEQRLESTRKEVEALLIDMIRNKHDV